MTSSHVITDTNYIVYVRYKKKKEEIKIRFKRSRNRKGKNVSSQDRISKSKLVFKFCKSQN